MRVSTSGSEAHGLGVEPESAAAAAASENVPATQKVLSFVLRDLTRGIVRLSMFDMFFEGGPHWQHQPEAKVLVTLGGNLVVRLQRRNEVMSLGPQEAVLVPADEPHTINVAGLDRRFRALSLRVAELPPNDLYRHLSRNQQQRSWRCDRVALRRTVRELRQLAGRPGPVPGEALMRAAWGLLVPAAESVTASDVDVLGRGTHADDDGDIDRRVLYIETRMQQMLAYPYDAAALATSIQVSVSQMNRLFNRHRGMSPMRRFQALRLEQAAQYLTYATLSIKQIAARCGFNDPDHFGRLFRQHRGMTPRAYREAHQPGRR